MNPATLRLPKSNANLIICKSFFKYLKLLLDKNHFGRACNLFSLLNFLTFGEQTTNDAC